MRIIFLPGVAFLTSMILYVLALRLFPRWKLLDFPERYGLTRRPIPYPAGVVAVATFLILLPMLPLTIPQITGIGCAAILLGVTCFVDDRWPLPPSLRLTVHLLTALLLMAFGIRVTAVTNPLPEMIAGGSSIVLDGGWLLAISVVFTIGWILLTINALNWFDGIPGQVSALSTIGFLTIGFLSLSERVQQPPIAILSFVLAAIALSSFLFDMPPPRVLMGDTGAMFFGLMLGILTVISGGKVATAFLVLGVPLIDVLMVILRRIRRGQSLTQGNREDQHLHHRLLNKGWSPRRIILLNVVIGTAFGITALFLDTWQKVGAGGLLLIVMIGLSWYSKKND